MSAEMSTINTSANEPSTTEESFKCVHIRNRYTENSPSKHIIHTSIESFYEDTLNPEDCVYEVLDKPVRRIYLDIEGIDMETSESHRLVLKIINDFREFIGTSISPAHVTYNAGSTGHPGHSYHVIFDEEINYQLLKNIVIAFKQLHPEYGTYIDESVYSVIRLFRLPFQCKQRADDTPDANDVHIPINLESQRLLDKEYWNDIMACNYIIQYIAGEADITVANLPDEAIQQIGRISLESKQSPLTKPHKSGGLRTTQFMETITAQMNEVKESNASLTKQVAELTKINEKLFSALSQILGQHNVPLDDN
jgi:hypothetical protein